MLRIVSSMRAWTETVLYSFMGVSTVDGNRPEAGLILDASGALYGTTFGGGTMTARYSS
jgi:hypothetical protein